MKVFISWSGSKSKEVASALRRWIPDVIQTVEPWMSQADIDAGARWNREIEGKLGETKFGIICLTKSNLTAPWILFESGALAKTIEDTFVCPYLIDLEPTDIPQGPLTQFQAKRANEIETWELVSTLNKAMKEDSLPEDKLRRAFDRWWPDLHNTLQTLEPEENSDSGQRSVGDMVSEVLDIVRGLSRRMPSGRTSGSTSRRLITQELLDKLVERDGGQCAKCGSIPPVLSVHHIRPVSLGGNVLDNLQLWCGIHDMPVVGKTVDNS